MRRIIKLIKDLYSWVRGGCKISKSALYRLAICYSCEFFDEENIRCKKCGCNMKYKTKMDTAKCPIDKW